MKVGIIGGGAAGLAAALELTSRGHFAEVFEAAPFLGGQASTFEVGGGQLERGYHHLFVSDTDMVDLINELGLGDSLEWLESKVGLFHGGRVWDFATPMDLLKFSPLPFVQRIRLGLWTFLLQKTRDWRKFEGVTAAEWTRDHMGEDAYRVIWEPMLRGKFGDYYDQVSMTWLWGKIYLRVASRKRMQKERLGYPMCSFGRVFDACGERIESQGGRVHIGAAVKQVNVEGGRATGFAANRRGVSGEDRLRLYTSAEAHSSVEKAVRIAGLGSESLRAIPIGEDGGMRDDELRSAIEGDAAAGATPILVVATVGTTGASGFDRLDRIGAICRRHGVMLHVDAAWAGTAAIAPEHRGLLDGVEHADSVVVNPHKWMMVNFDCSAHFVRDAAAYVRTFEIVPEYLRTTEHGRVIDYRDWGIALGRRFRALKLWFVIRSYGVEGLRAIVRRHVALAGELAAAIDAEEDFELVVAPRLALLCFRYRPSGVEDAAALDELNERLLRALNDSGRLYLTQTRVAGAYVIRFCVGQTTTERRHVDAAWAAIREVARGLSR